MKVCELCVCLCYLSIVLRLDIEIRDVLSLHQLQFCGCVLFGSCFGVHSVLQAEHTNQPSNKEEDDENELEHRRSSTQIPRHTRMETFKKTADMSVSMAICTGELSHLPVMITFVDVDCIL